MNNKMFTLPYDCDIVLPLFSLKLVEEGFRVDRSFDIYEACASFTETTCPHDEQSPCDCRLVTLFAYQEVGLSIPLVFHGHAGQTEVYIDTSARQSSLDLEMHSASITRGD